MTSSARTPRREMGKKQRGEREREEWKKRIKNGKEVKKKGRERK